MKKQSFRIFLMCSVLAILAVSSAQAQSVNTQTANVPFAFSVGTEVFPAGLYSVTRINPQSDKAALAIRSADGRLSRIVLTMPVKAGLNEERARLVFSRYDDQYFLSEVWTPAARTGLELRKSRSERLLARNAQDERAARVTIALDARLR